MFHTKCERLKGGINLINMEEKTERIVINIIMAVLIISMIGFCTGLFIYSTTEEPQEEVKFNYSAFMEEEINISSTIINMEETNG